METSHYVAPSALSLAVRKAGALFYLTAIAAVPILIVGFTSSHGGIWVAGYVTGMITVPAVALGVMRAVSELADLGDLDILTGSVVYGLFVTLLSIGAVIWSLLRAGHP